MSGKSTKYDPLSDFPIVECRLPDCVEEALGDLPDGPKLFTYSSYTIVELDELRRAGGK